MSVIGKGTNHNSEIIPFEDDTPSNGHKSSLNKTTGDYGKQGQRLKTVIEEDEPETLRFDSFSSVLQQLRSNSIVRSYLYCGTLIAIWYTLSTFLNLYNRNLMGQDRGGFPVPLLMSSFQFLLQFLLSNTILRCGLIQRTVDAPPSWSEWSRTTLPNGISTGLDIGFSNKSYMFITVTFYTMCKSTTPMFLLLFAYLWGIEKLTWQILKVVVLISLGLFLFVYGETSFQWFGFMLVMTAAALAGFRWMMTQVQLQGTAVEGGHVSQGGPLEVMERLTPIMAFTTLFLALTTERDIWSLGSSRFFSSLDASMITFVILSVGGLVAWVMVWTEFKVIQQTSSLTLIIAGTFKELFTVFAGVFVDGDRFTWINGMGLIVLIMGVALYNYQKYQKMKQGEIKSYNRARNEHDEQDESSNLEMQPLNQHTNGNSSHPTNGKTDHAS
eukprot:TRINITY_DN16673_c0_g1_i1.p1 TRINITY_DN16673_c0_g1~~TRINITY_DN16673_c0_g1_i1.p1  ORF type:complete len:441 (+),score=42.80 TRINITY_DN16673_c0_g1_i1:167-1489(+)